MPKVSVIVPVYKVEQYIRRCVNSILNQDFSDYEIILVDDGSPDDCPSICDEYAEKNATVKVIHKKNGGLSEARNIGVAHAEGKYIIFVDSDDYVDRNHISSLWDVMVRNNADMGCSSPIIEYETSDMVIQNVADKNIIQRERFAETSASTIDAQAMILRGYPVGTSAWAKIIKRGYCLKHPFPKGKVLEELATTYYLVGEARKVAFTGVATYHYVQRKGSILHSSFRLKEIDEYMGIAEQYAINAPTLDIKYAAAERLVLLAGRLSCATQENEEADAYRLITKYCRRYVCYCIKDKKLSLREKLRAILMSMTSGTVRFFVWQKKKRKMS